MSLRMVLKSVTLNCVITSEVMVKSYRNIFCDDYTLLVLIGHLTLLQNNLEGLTCKMRVSACELGGSANVYSAWKNAGTRCSTSP